MFGVCLPFSGRFSVYRNNVKNRFLAALAFHQNFDSYSNFVFWRSSLAANQSFDEPLPQNSDTSCCRGINLSFYGVIKVKGRAR